MTDPGHDLRITELLVSLAVQLRKMVEHDPTLIPAHAVAQVQHRVLPLAELHALVDGVEESVRPEFRIDTLSVPDSAGQEDGEGRKILVFIAQSVAEPGTHARAIPLLRTRLKKGERRVVVDRLRVHGTNDADIISDACGVRQQVADPRLRLPVLFEIDEGADQREGCLIGCHARQPLGSADGGRHLLSLHLAELRFEIKELLLRRGTVLK